MNPETHILCIAEHYIKITFLNPKLNNVSLISSSVNFMVPEKPADQEYLYEMVVDDDLKPIEKSRRDRVRDFESGNGTTIIDLLDDGGYQVLFKDNRGNECSMLQSNKDFSKVKCALKGNFDARHFGLANCVMLTISMAGSYKDTLMIHASLVRHNGYGYPFCAVSGTGKSTHVSMWLRYIPNCDLMNDDNPIIRIIDGKPYIFGTPWSGKTPCYRNVKAPLGAMSRIDRADHNYVEKLSPIEAFTSVLPSCSSMKWDIDIYRHICDTVTKVVETTNAYIIHCLPDREAAEVSCATIAVK